MNKLIIASCIIAFSFGWTVKTSDHCSCSDYVFSFDCMQSIKFGCAWSFASSVCKEVDCTKIEAIACLAYENHCQLSQIDGVQSCTKFSSCSSLKGKTDYECRIQNKKCSLPTGTESNCVDFKCSLYNSKDCPTDCYLENEQCQAVPNCEGQTENHCNILPKEYCTYVGGVCQKAKCSDYIESLNCYYTYISEQEIQPCFWNDSTCINATESSDVNNFQTCYAASKGAYHWSSSLQTGGSCKACHGIILQVLFMILLYLA